MTILNALLILWDWYLKNDVFEIESDFLKLVKVSDSPCEDKAAILLALEDMEKSDIVKSICTDFKKCWVLRSPVSSLPQNVQISGDLAFQIASALNLASGPKHLSCDVFRISEKDIRGLFEVIALLLSTSGEPEKKK